MPNAESPYLPTRLRSFFTFRPAAFLATLASLLIPSIALAQAGSYVEKNIISDGSVPAQLVDPSLINPWGVSIGQEFWINTTGTGFSLVDDASGKKSFAVTIPPASSSIPHGLPAGTVFNPDGGAFTIPGSNSATFLFGNLDGSIAAWNSSTPEAVIVINNSSSKASYSDIAIDKNNTGTFLLAANFAGGKVDVFDSSFAPAHLSGDFSDSTLPAGYAPFGIHTMGNTVYVTYAQINDQGRENVGAGLGYVDAFDLNGTFLKRAISQGNLNAPWGMALAPSNFGPLGGDLLVANFGDGVINAYDPNTYDFKGQVTDSKGAPIANPGLWEIVFGVGSTFGGTPATAGDPNTLYFAAGVNDEKGGLFGSITVAPPAQAGDFTIGSSAATVSVTGSQVGNLSLSLAATNGFSGTVSLSCSGLPSGLSCNFTPASVSVSGTTPVNVGVAFSAGTAAPITPTSPYTAEWWPRSRRVLAGLLPITLFSFAGVRRRSKHLRRAILAIVCILSLGAMTGCSGGGSSPAPAAAPPSSPAPVTPAPATSQVTITATSGSLSHSVTVSLMSN
jgi:uncharacterized protein (TIGR03118 family)